MPRVSVHMPVYNAERFLAPAIESILAQTFTDFEFIIIDDGSTDASPKILDEFASRDERIKLTHRANRGITKTRNEALEAAIGEFFAVMDADDVAMPERFARQVAHFDAHPDCVAVGSRVLLIDAEGAPIREMSEATAHDVIDAAHLDGRGGEITHPASMMRRQALVDVGGYREQFATAEDLDVFLRLAERGAVANLPEVLLHYRQHVTSTCHTKSAQVRRDNHAVVAEAHLRRGLQPPSATSNGAEPANSEADHHRKWAWWALRAGNVATARKHAWFALKSAPTASDSWRVWVCALRGR